VTELVDVPPPSEATWVGHWKFFDGSCGHQHWMRMFGLRSWTVETIAPCRTEVELIGAQLSNSSIDLGVWIHGDTESLDADEALMLAAALSRAAEELERIEGCSL
jgi:hypothetical protein